jgi:hypothetical protein
MRTLQMTDPLPLKLGRKVTNVISPAYEAALKAHEARKSELFAFLGKCDRHITEADCRKRKDAPAEQAKQSTEPAPQEPQADAEGWVTHDGKSMPVAADVIVDVKKSHGGIFLRCTAGFWASGSTNNWVAGECNPGFEIAAFRIVA